MNKILTFFGQIIKKSDLDFLNTGNRQASVVTHIDLTQQGGGVINGLDVFSSSDGLSIVVMPGSFYSSGPYNENNGFGGGERGEIFTTQTFTGLPITNNIGAGIPTYLLVYAKTTTQNSDPNPLHNQAIYSTKNIQTGENEPVREYTVGKIIVTNPIPSSEVKNYDGVPLALVTVGQNGTITTIDTSIKTNYAVGGTLDVVTGFISDKGIQDNFITTRMVSGNSITGDKFADNSITSVKIASWDGSSTSEISGNGIATAHLKDGAVTTSKLNYSGSMINFNERNRVFNASFENYGGIVSGISSASKWNINADAGTYARRDTISTAKSLTPKFGDAALFIQGGSLGGNALNVQVDQVVDFGGSINNTPISAYFWIKQQAQTSFTLSGTTGFLGQIDFLNSADTIIQTNTFGPFSGNSTDWNLIYTPSPIAYSGTTDIAKKVRLTLGGKFEGSYYIDGVYLGTSSILPGFDVAPPEYFSIDSLSASLISGQLTSSQIQDGSISTNKIGTVDGSAVTDSANGIVTAQIRDSAITTSKIADGAITATKLDPAAGLVPVNALILWDTTDTCPDGYTEATEFSGFFPIGRNSSTGSTLNAVGKNSDAKVGGAIAAKDVSNNGTVGSAETVGNHTHPLPKNRDNVSQGPGGAGTANDLGATNDGGSHGHNLKTPYRTVLFCRKDA
jgi:hypothetical protein